MSAGRRPSVTLKIATSLDGRIATGSGESKWITGEAAREEVHRLRAAHDAILVGSRTVLSDDPSLTVRLPGFAGPQPLRVVADARLRTPTACLLVESAGRTAETLIITREDALPERLKAMSATAAKLVVLSREPEWQNGLNPHAVLAELPVTSVMIEGGGQLAAGFMRAGLIDRIEWFRAPIVLGGDARPCVAALELERLAEAPRFRRTGVQEVGPDLWERYELSDRG